ncbi:MAG TPA: hypothetical protein VGG39_27550 [Polyangiaceae bacterium]
MAAHRVVGEAREIVAQDDVDVDPRLARLGTPSGYAPAQMVPSSVQESPRDEGAVRGSVALVGTGAAVLAFAAGLLAYSVAFQLEADHRLVVSPVIAAVALATVAILSRVVGRRHGAAGRAAVWLATSGAGVLMAYAAHVALGRSLVIADVRAADPQASLLWVPVVALGGLAIAAAAGWMVGPSAARASRTLAGVAVALTLTGAVLAVASTLRSTRPGPDAYLHTLPVERVIPALGTTPLLLDVDATRTPEITLGPLHITRGPFCELEIRTDPAVGPPAQVMTNCDHTFKVRHDAKQRLWVFEEPVIDLARRPSEGALPPGQRPLQPYVPRTAVDDTGTLRAFSPIDIGGSLAPPPWWVLVAALGCAGATAVLLRARFARQRLPDDARADASYAAECACAIAIVALTCAPLGAAAADGLVFGDARLDGGVSANR